MSFSLLVGSLEGAYRQVADRLNSIDLRFEGIDRRLDGIDRTIDKFRRDMDQRFMWLIGTIVTSWVTTILAILHHH